METWHRIGVLEIACIIDYHGPFMPLGKFFPDATPEAIAAHRSWLIPTAMDAVTEELILPIQSFLIRTNRHLMLVDTCIGNDKSCTWFPAWNQRSDANYLAQFQRLGIGLDEIDYVFCTHLHVDHCGWHTRLEQGRWVPTFPHARYIFSRIEFEHAERESNVGDDPTFTQNVAPIADAKLAILVEHDYQVDDQVWLEPTPGHTPGHVAIRLAAGSGKAVITGDLIHSPLQCFFPAWNFRYDFDPALAQQTRRQFLERYADSGITVLASHFPLPSIGFIHSTARAFRYEYHGDD